MKSPLRPTALLVILLLTVSACQPSASASPGASEPATGVSSGGDLVGDIQVSGSSTVEPISSLVFEAFVALHPEVTGFIDGPGTGDGMALFCADELDVADASRQISESETADCEAAGVEWVELKIGIDGMAVITSSFNDAFDCLSFLDLYALLGPESQGFDTWDAADDLAADLDAALGSDFGEGHGPYPADDLIVTAPGDESGTYDSFVELAIRGIADEREQERTTRLDYTPQDEDPAIIEGVAGTQDALGTLGWVGFAFADQNRDRVSLLAVDQGDGCIEATPDTIASAEYPLSRFLYLYVNVGRADANPAVGAFVDFYLSDDGMAKVIEADYIALPEADIEATRAAWHGR